MQGSDSIFGTRLPMHGNDSGRKRHRVGCCLLRRANLLARPCGPCLSRPRFIWRVAASAVYFRVACSAYVQCGNAAMG